MVLKNTVRCMFKNAWCCCAMYIAMICAMTRSNIRHNWLYYAQSNSAKHVTCIVSCIRFSWYMFDHRHQIMKDPALLPWSWSLFCAKRLPRACATADVLSFFLCWSFCMASCIWSSHFSAITVNIRYLHFVLKVECMNDISLTGKWLVSDTGVSIIR